MQIQQNTPQNISAPLVSFIVTVYNLPIEFIKQCINSILALSLQAKDREIIIIDDGSRIPALEELAEIKDDIIYLRQRNQGPSMARNMGLKIATGKYIQFVDGDDYLIQAPYEHCLDIVRYHNPDIVLFNETKKKHADLPLSLSEPVTGASYMHNHNLHAAVWEYIFLKKILVNLQFTPGLLCEDEEFTPLLFLRADRVISTNAEAYYYRKRKHSIIQEKERDHVLHKLTDVKKIIFHLQDISAAVPEFDRVALQRRIAQLTMDYLYNIIKQTRSHKLFHDTIEILKARRLFPLPDKKYTRKYTLFRKVINTKIGQEILFIFISRL